MVKRTYDRTRRSQAAQRSRLEMITQAHALFLGRGFAATTMAAVAEAAGVSVQNVYRVFETKTGLAKAVFDVAIAGDGDDKPMVERASLVKARDEPDPRLKLEYYGQHLAEVAPRLVPLQLVLLDAAAVDPDAAEVWAQLQDERLRGMTLFATDLASNGHLREDVPMIEARDVLWTYNSAELYRLLVIERQWSPDRYGRWVGQALIAALLP